MKIRTHAPRAITLLLAACAALPSAGCADQEAGFYVSGFTVPEEKDGLTTCDPEGDIATAISLSTSSLNTLGVVYGCIAIQSRFSRPVGTSAVEDQTNPWAIVLERAEIDLLRGGVAIESFDFALNGRVGDNAGGNGVGSLGFAVPVASAATATSLGGSLGAGEQTQLEIEIRVFGHTAGGTDVETEPFRAQAIYLNDP